jgi:RNase H-like domain found in reverse transcriptase
MVSISKRGPVQSYRTVSEKKRDSFLGFCNFYHVFIPHFSDKSRPLNDLTCKNHQWEWTEHEQQAFQSLKDVCATLPVLHCPDWSKRFILETDALGYALGAIISQEFDDSTFPIAFHSRSLLPAEKNYDTHNKELTAVLFGFKCGRPLFLGATHPIEVHTNHKNLQYFRQPQKITSQQARWIEYLQDFNYKLTHVPGHMNMVADLLSRRKDLNKEVNTDKPRVLLDDTLFSDPKPVIQKLFLDDDIEKR